MGDLKFLPEGKGFLLVEFGGETREESDEKAERMMRHLRWSLRATSMKLYDDPTQEHLVWEIRESGLGATARVPGEPDTWEGWEDSAVPPDQLGSLMNMLPDHPLARRLSRQTFLLSEFLEKEAPDFRPPRLDATALVHGHCHHKALMKMEG